LNVRNLEYFETLNYILETSRVKRNLDGQELIKELKFTAFQRNFHLTLKSGTDVLANNFHAHLVESDGSITPFYIDHSLLYSGYLADNVSVTVSAHIEDRLWSIQIYDHNDTYVLEPARNLLKESENVLNDTFIAYRSSDLINNTWKCGTHHHSKSLGDLKLKLHDGLMSNLTNWENRAGRDTRRKKHYLNTCVMSIIGDYDLFSRKCHFNYLTCSAMMISLVENGDRIFRSTIFVDKNNKPYTGIGLQIGYSLEYFMSFSKRHFCLTHLMTSYPLPDRILGIADTRGICIASKKGTYVKSCALTSTIDSFFGPLTTYQMKQVFVHGHNFGSEHDSRIPECSHIEQEGGSFIMWDKIGPARHLYSKFCGNGIVDPGEECDAGAAGLLGADICCTKECKLEDRAMCCDMNSQCCSNCYIAARGTVCYDHSVVACKGRSYCTGLCHNGTCKGFCEVKSLRENVSLKACMCRSTDEDACRWCCYDDRDPQHPGPCVPHSSQALRDGQTCYHGYCEVPMAFVKVKLPPESEEYHLTYNQYLVLDTFADCDSFPYQTILFFCSNVYEVEHCAVGGVFKFNPVVHPSLVCETLRIASQPSSLLKLTMDSFRLSVCQKQYAHDGEQCPKINWDLPICRLQIMGITDKCCVTSGGTKGDKTALRRAQQTSHPRCHAFIDHPIHLPPLPEFFISPLDSTRNGRRSTLVGWGDLTTAIHELSARWPKVVCWDLN
ncbi:hypothetical protein Btru_025110, partial [Bulinus truncatus]